MLTAESDFRKVLRNELEARLGRLPRYSLRAFAKDLGLAPSRLSEILSGKQGLSRARAQSVGERLGLALAERELFCDLVESEHARGQVGRELARLRLEKQKLDQSYKTLELDAFAAVSDWYHFALHQMTGLAGFKSDIKWIAKRLEISTLQVTEALERLERLGLIKREKGRITRAQEFIATPEGIPSAAIRKFHRQILERALVALESQPVEERNFSVMITPIDKKKLKDAQRWVKSFRRRFAGRVSENGMPTDVYCLAVQLFNLTPSAAGDAK